MYSDLLAAAFDAVVVAASLGGRHALEEVLAPLPPTFPVPILVLQHVNELARSFLPQILASRTQLRVKHAACGEQFRTGTVYVAPPGRHMLVGANGRCEFSDSPRVNFARPAADVLFESAARAFGPRTLAVVLTGRLHDGAAGAAAIRRAGGVVLVQDPASCRAPDMPRAVIRSGSANFTLPPQALAAALIALVTVPGAPALFGLRPQPAGSAA